MLFLSKPSKSFLHRPLRELPARRNPANRGKTAARAPRPPAASRPPPEASSLRVAGSKQGAGTPRGIVWVAPSLCSTPSPQASQRFAAFPTAPDRTQAAGPPRDPQCGWLAAASPSLSPLTPCPPPTPPAGFQHLGRLDPPPRTQPDPESWPTAGSRGGGWGRKMAWPPHQRPATRPPAPASRSLRKPHRRPQLLRCLLRRCRYPGQRLRHRVRSGGATARYPGRVGSRTPDRGRAHSRPRPPPTPPLEPMLGGL